MTASPPESATGPEPTPELAALLQEALKALSDAGEADAACRLAARACAVLRQRDPTLWRRFNALLHRIGPKSGPVGTRAEGA